MHWNETSDKYPAINGDNNWKILRPLQTVAYLSTNWLNNLIQKTPTNSRLVHARFRPTRAWIEQNWDAMYDGASPSRITSQLFLKALPWQRLTVSLGHLPDVLDYGCGSGGYATYLRKMSDNRIGRYTGIDINFSPLWNSRSDHMTKFKVIPKKPQKSDFPESTQFILSQSALEHIKNDVGIFKTLQSHYFEKPGTKGTQIHLVPTIDNLFLYGLHGYRQYGARQLEFFLDDSSIPGVRYFLIQLGGQRSIDFHGKWIHHSLKPWIKDKRKTHKKAYCAEVKNVIIDDLTTSNSPSSLFYAFVADYGNTLQLDKEPWFFRS